jgi:hypothetical protein
MDPSIVDESIDANVINATNSYPVSSHYDLKANGETKQVNRSDFCFLFLLEK